MIDEILALPPYSLDAAAKRELFLGELRALCARHYARSEVYRNVVDRVFGGARALQFDTLEAMPFLPVSLFKTHEIRSIADADIIKVLTSSGTTGQSVSKIYLDKDTANLQAQALVKTAQHFLGKDRLPMVIVDHAEVIRDRQSYSARGAGILGMAQFGRQPFYALRSDMSLDLDGLRAYLHKFAGSRIFFFGFTFMVWQHLVQELERRGERLDLSDAVLIHSGGWKKLIELAVSPSEFRRRVQTVCGSVRVINFYGMVEQVGGVYFENEAGYLHASNFSDVIVRDPITLSPVPDGSAGLIQTISFLPRSYAGHSILTEDIGVVRGVDDPQLNMRGRYFEILGRVPKSEPRGCSDTFHMN